jgi:hypothetical protein
MKFSNTIHLQTAWEHTVVIKLLMSKRLNLCDDPFGPAENKYR